MSFLLLPPTLFIPIINHIPPFAPPPKRLKGPSEQESSFLPGRRYLTYLYGIKPLPRHKKSLCQSGRLSSRNTLGEEKVRARESAGDTETERKETVNEGPWPGLRVVVGPEALPLQLLQAPRPAEAVRGQAPAQAPARVQAPTPTPTPLRLPVSDPAPAAARAVKESAH